MRSICCSIVVIAVCGLFGPSAAAQPAWEAESFNYFANDWNVVGLKDYRHGSRVTPENELLLGGKTAIQVRLGRELVPLSQASPKLAMHGWMPIILLRAADGPVRYEVAFWATPLPDAKDWRKAFGWPTEGENYLNWIRVKAVNTSDSPAEARVEIGPNANSTVPKRFVEEQAQPRSERTHSRVYKWSWTLGPGKTTQEAARYTYFPIENPEAYDEEDSGVWLQRTEDFWRGMITEHTAHIEVPCRKASEALLAAHVCQLIANDHGELRGGEDFYDRQVVEDFYCYLLHTTAAHAFPEGIYYKDRIAWNHTIPHVTGACNYAIMLRHMLIHEAGDELHLLSAVPDWWLNEGEEIRVEAAPTHFGEMGILIRGTAKGVEVRLDRPTRNPPKRIVLTLPKSRPLVSPLEGVEVATRSDQEKRWDFPTIISLYKELQEKSYAFSCGE